MFFSDGLGGPDLFNWCIFQLLDLVWKTYHGVPQEHDGEPDGGGGVQGDPVPRGPLDDLCFFYIWISVLIIYISQSR